MDPPIYYAGYFVNKQHVRSFSNILKIKLLKSENETKFLEHIFQDKHLVSEITTDIKSILSRLRSNVRICSKNDFKNYFLIQGADIGRLCLVNKVDILVHCLIALREIIPKSLFGCNHNYKIFKKNMKIILYSMKRQCFYLSTMLQNWKFDVHPWSGITSNINLKVLERILTWIYRYLLAAMISLNFYVTTCKLDADENKLNFFWKNQWQSFYDKNISRMLFTKVIKKNSLYNSKLNKKIKHSEKDGIPKLYLILKPNNECRPIVHYKKEIRSVKKYKTKEKLNFLKVLAAPLQERLENQYETLHKNWLKNNKPKLYFVKSDLSNAFGSINRKKLLKILSERHQIFQNTEKLMSRKHKFALLHREFVSELKKPLLIRTGSSVYEWIEGLVQGYKYSPALAELYYSYMDQLYFCKHMQKTDESLRVFVRIVDDYLYITDSLEDAQLFLQSLALYRNVNYKKTIVNFPDAYVKFQNEITFLGYTYDTNNLFVSRARNVFIGKMCYKISFIPAINNLETFISNRIGQSAIQINSHIFNLNYNNEKQLWHHIFVTLILSANKFCTILAILCDERNMLKYMFLYKNIVSVKLCNSIVETILISKPEKCSFLHCENHFRYLSFKALFLCAKFTPKCNILIPFINKELAKCNCIFGKWRDHSSKMNKYGTSITMAIKDICKRQDLSIIMRDFDTLPTGVECFNTKIFYKQ